MRVGGVEQMGRIGQSRVHVSFLGFLILILILILIQMQEGYEIKIRIKSKIKRGDPKKGNAPGSPTCATNDLKWGFLPVIIPA
jgi:hypothetical protein